MTTNEAILNLIVSENLIVKKIVFVRRGFNEFDVYEGFLLSNIFSKEDVEKIRNIPFEQNKTKVIRVCLFSTYYWLKIQPSGNDYSFQFYAVNPIEKNIQLDNFNTTLLDFIDEGIILINNVGKIVYANKTFCQWSKYSLSALRGKMFYPLFIHSDKYYHLYITNSYHDVLISYDGTLIPIQIKNYFLELPNQETLTVCYIKNLSNFQKIENELSLREQILESIFYASQQFLFSDNWNENIHQVLCHFGNSVQASKIRLFENVLNENHDFCMKLNAEWINQNIKQPNDKIDSPIPYFPSYESIFTELSQGQVYYLDGEEKNLIFQEIHSTGSAILVPITVKNRWWGFLYAEVIQSLKIWKPLETTTVKQLSSLIGAAIYQHEIMLEKDALIKKAEENNKLKTTFLSNIGHELSTPLNSIIGFSDLIKKKVNVEEKIAEYINYIYDNGYRLLNKIDKLVEYAKLESGSFILQKETINLSNFFMELSYWTQLLLKKYEKKLTVHVHIEEENIEIITDRKRLMHIFEQLIDNAVKFTSSGSIEMGYKRKANGVECFVMDTGIGIAPEHQKVIFDKFRFLENETTRTKPGMGIGLSIVELSVKALQGTIRLQSEYKKGATFFIWLPGELILNESRQIPIESEQPDTIYVFETDDDLYFKTYTLLKQSYKSIKRFYSIEDIEFEKARMIILNSHNIQPGMRQTLKEKTNKYSHIKLIEHRLKNIPFSEIKLSITHDEYYWNILAKIKKYPDN